MKYSPQNKINTPQYDAGSSLFLSLCALQSKLDALNGKAHETCLAGIVVMRMCSFKRLQY